MLEWLMLLSQLALWTLVIQLYRSRNRAIEAIDAARAADRATSELDLSESDWADIAFSPVASVPTPSPMESGELQRLSAQLQLVTERLDREVVARTADHRAILGQIENQARAKTARNRAPDDVALQKMARSTGRQREELDLLLHLARRAEGGNA